MFSLVTWLLRNDENCALCSIWQFHPVLLLFFQPRTSNTFSHWELQFSNLCCNLSVFSACFLFTYFLHSSESYPSFTVWLDVPRIFASSVDLYPQRDLCHCLLLRFSYFSFFFSVLFFLFSILSSTFDLSSKYPYDIYRRSNIWIVLCLVFPLKISQAVMFPWYFHWH